MHPWRRRLGRKATLFIVVCIWAVSSGVAAPNFIVYTTEVLFECNSFRVICYSRWPDGDQADSRLEYFHSIVVIVLTYVVPMLSMGFTYTRMGVMLWGSRAIGEPTPRLRDALRSKRKVVKMMIVVVLIFGVCWLPFHMYFVLYNQIPEINSYKYIQEVYLALYWLAMSNSMYNPMIYCWLNSRFRNGFKRVLAPWCPCIPSLATPSGPVRNNTTQSNVFASIGPPGAADRLHCDNSVTLRSYLKPSEKLPQCPLSTSSTTLRSNVSSRSNTGSKSGQDHSNGNSKQPLTKLTPNGLQNLKIDPNTPRCTTPV